MANEDGPVSVAGWDSAALEAVFAEVIDIAAATWQEPLADQWPGPWVVAHLIATNRILAAATADLLGGGIPVIDDRAASVPQYLAAIVESAGSAGLDRCLEGSVRELLALVRQLSDEQLSKDVPTISSENGHIQRQSPLPFAQLLSVEHVRTHLEQLRPLAAQSTT